MTAAVVRRSRRLTLEQVYPYLLGIIAGVCVVFFGEEISNAAESRSWKLAQAYGATAGLASVLAGFLGVFYGLIVAKTSEFLQRIDGHPSFVRYSRYLKISMIWSFAIAVVSVPFVIVEPVPGPINNPGSWLVAAWCGGVITMLALSYRVATEFFILVEPMEMSDRK